MTNKIVLLVAGLFALALTACSSESSDTRAAPPPTVTTAATTSTAPITTTAPIATEAPIATTEETTAQEIDQASLVLVVFGDSIVSHPSPDAAVIGRYAGMLEDEFGVPVDVRNHSVWSSSPTNLLDALGSERVLADLAEADVVVLEVPLGDSAVPFSTATGWQGRDPADCGGDDHQECLRDYLIDNKASVEAIFSALVMVCDPSVTLIRALDVYQLQVEDQIAMGTLLMTNPYWQGAQEFLEETAAKYGIPVAQVYDEFMGPDGTDDPQDRGLVTTDQRHPTSAGAQLIAEMIHDLGYDFGS